MYAMPRTVYFDWICIYAFIDPAVIFPQPYSNTPSGKFYYVTANSHRINQTFLVMMVHRAVYKTDLLEEVYERAYLHNVLIRRHSFINVNLLYVTASEKKVWLAYCVIARLGTKKYLFEAEINILSKWESLVIGGKFWSKRLNKKLQQIISFDKHAIWLFQHFSKKKFWWIALK